MLQCICRIVALNRLVATSDMSPLLGAERTRRRHLISADIDPNVWTRRALQEKTVRLEYTVLHQCIRPRIGADAPDHHGIRARPISLAAMPRRAIWVISSRLRWKDHFSISSFSLADLGGKSDRDLHRVSP